MALELQGRDEPDDGDDSPDCDFNVACHCQSSLSVVVKFVVKFVVIVVLSMICLANASCSVRNLRIAIRTALLTPIVDPKTDSSVARSCLSSIMWRLTRLSCFGGGTSKDSGLSASLRHGVLPRLGFAPCVGSVRLSQAPRRGY